MKKVAFSFLILSLGFFIFKAIKKSTRAKSEIIISDRMIDLIDAMNALSDNGKSMLVVFDVDDTLYQSAKLAGTPNWFYNMVNKLRENGIEKAKAYQFLSKIDYILQEHISIKPVENAILVALEDLQKRGIKVLAITSRPARFAPFIERQLSSLNIKFSHPAFDCVKNLWNDENGELLDGVLYVGFRAKKAQAINHVLKNLMRCGSSPNSLVFADDQPRYVSEVAHIAKRENLHFIGLIYGNAVNARHFDLVKANKQISKLENRLGIMIVPEEIRGYFNL